MVQVGTKAETSKTDLVALLVVSRHLLLHIRQHTLHILLRHKLPDNIIIEDPQPLLEGSQ